MNTTLPTTAPQQIPPLLPIETLVSAIGTLTRWRILARLSDNLGYTIADVAHAVGVSYATAYTHLALLRKIGIVTEGRGRLLRISPAYQPDPTQRTLEFGHCTLRFAAATQTA